MVFGIGDSREPEVVGTAPPQDIDVVKPEVAEHGSMQYLADRVAKE